MKPIDFPQANMQLAERQDEYQTLPVFREGGDDGLMVCCWSLGWWERLKLLFTGRLWLMVLTFNQPFHPILPMVEHPFGKDKNDQLLSSTD